MLAVVLSFDHFPLRLLGCYGNSLVEMPCLNEIAAESIVFDQHFGEDFSPSPDGHANWSGCYHFPRKGTVLLSQIASLAQLLNAGDVEAHWLTEDVASSLIPLPHDAAIVACDSFEKIFVEACERLKKSSRLTDARQMLWLKVGPSDWEKPLGVWGSAENAHALARLDQAIEPLWEAIRGEVNQRKILFVVTSAQGLSLGERASLLKEETPWTEEFVHLPLVVYHSETAGGERRSELTQTMDLPATLLDFFALTPPAQWEGRSLLPSVLGETPTGREFVTSGYQGVWDAIRTREFHLVRQTDPAHPEETRRLLFAKPDDVWDWQDVSAQEPEVTETLTRQLDAFLLAAKTQVPVIFPASDFAPQREGEGTPP